MSGTPGPAPGFVPVPPKGVSGPTQLRGNAQLSLGQEARSTSAPSPRTPRCRLRAGARGTEVAPDRKGVRPSPAKDLPATARR